MKRHKDKWAMADDLRAQHEEDGFSGRVSRRRRQENKLGGLCRQVQRTIGLSLSGECHDQVLRDLHVWTVLPAPDASRLLVQVYFGASRPEVSLVELLGRLDRVNPWLRGEVARSIVRKRAPELLFQLIDPREAREEEVNYE
jgi:ribosome-binding factor A